MNKAVLSLMCATAILFNAGIAAAKDHKTMPPKDVKEMQVRMSEKLSKELNLTDEQKAQAKKIREEGKEKIKPLMKEMKELREKIDEARKENMKEFENILTAEQKAQFEKIKAEKKMHRKEKGMHKKGGRHNDAREKAEHNRVEAPAPKK